jgi:hypothetical protein
LAAALDQKRTKKTKASLYKNISFLYRALKSGAITQEVP